MSKIPYNIAVDIGTSSVGYAVLDMQGKLVKLNSRNLWGVRLFNEGDTAVETRLFRNGRRRYVRRRQRIKLFQNLISEDLLSVDEGFFARLKESFLHREDRESPELYILFNDKEFDEVKYYNRFPTIYHLRQHLMDSEEKADIRLVYLALHHIIKYRGNFLYEGQELQGGIDLVSAVNTMLDSFYLCEEWDADKKSDVAFKVSEIIKDKKEGKRDRKKAIEVILDFDKEYKQVATNLSALLLGSKGDLRKLFSLDAEEDIKIALSDDDSYEKASESLNDEQIICFENMQKVYSATILSNLLSNSDGSETYPNISLAMINKYEKHSYDLKLLKNFYKNHLSKAQYKKMFSSDKRNKGAYEKYIHAIKSFSVEDLYKAIIKDIESISSSESKFILSEIEKGNFLPKINSKDNGAIPYQLHKHELIKILEKQSKFYPSLAENKDKIISILEFKIPYYVGPLSGDQTRFNWATRKADGKIYPWNFNDIVDTDKAAEDFITRMRNSCTYLPLEDVLPKNSLLYTEYEVRNEIKQIKLDDHFMAHYLQNELYEEIFKVYKTVKMETLKNWLKQKGITPTKITGFQKENEFASSMKSYIDFKNILGEVNHKDREMIEEIILWLTLFNEKEIIDRKIRQKYENISSAQRKKIINLKYAGWGRLSKKLLTGIKAEDRHGNYKSIMDLLRSTDKNFMQILYNKEYKFLELIDEENNFAVDNPLSYESVKNLYTSPANKRCIWQTILVIKEIEKIMRHPPQNIYVEFARSEEEKRRTDSRYKDLEKKYEKALNDNSDLQLIISDLKKYEKNPKAFDDRALYLYFLQNGKCLYTGRRIDIDQLNRCEIDHIIPRSYIKDDSFENLALVYRGENQRKSDSLLLDESIIQKQNQYWKHLKKCGLMGDKKYNNLTRTNFSNDALKGFIARQLVETRQITKHVVNLLKQHYTGTDIVAIRAGLSHDIREKYELYKCRDINDYHHAYDAFLAGVIGRYIQTCFPYLEDEIICGEYRKFIKDKKKEGKKDRGYGYVVDGFQNIKHDKETGEVLWDGEDMVHYLIKAYNYKDYYVSKKQEELTGEFYNQTIYSKTDSKASIPLKKNLPVEKYGGYSGVTQAYYAVIEYDHKKGRKKELVGIPVYIVRLQKTKSNAITEYLIEQGYNNAVILKDKIKKYQKIAYEGHEYYLVADSEVSNAKQLILSPQDVKVIHLISSSQKPNNVSEDELDFVIEHIIEKISFQYPCFKDIVDKIIEKMDDVNKLPFEQKVKFIKSLLIMTQANSRRTDLSVYVKGLSSRAGRLDKRLQVDKIEFIDNSVTGFFEHRTKL